MALSDEDKQWMLQQLQRFTTKEELKRVETNLLTQFHNCASLAELRRRTHAAVLRAIDMEMEVPNDRVKKLEGSGPPTGA